MLRGRRFQFGAYPGYNPKATEHHIIAYHSLVLNEMKLRGFNVNSVWLDPSYRGAALHEAGVSFPLLPGDETIARLLKRQYRIFALTQTQRYLEECCDVIRSRTGFDIGHEVDMARIRRIAATLAQKQVDLESASFDHRSFITMTDEEATQLLRAHIESAYKDWELPE
jgi:uncharacterized protein (TIGR02328 family)